MKKISKVLLIIIIVLLNIVYYNFFYQVLSTDNFSTSEYDSAEGDSGVNRAVTKVFGGAVNVMRIVSGGIAGTMLFVLAGKYMLSAPEGRADVRRTAVAYFIGAFILFSISGILGKIGDMSTF